MISRNHLENPKPFILYFQRLKRLEEHIDQHIDLKICPSLSAYA